MNRNYVQLSLTRKRIAPNNKMYTPRKKDKRTWVYSHVPHLIGQENKRAWADPFYSYFVPNMPESFALDASKSVAPKNNKKNTVKNVNKGKGSAKTPRNRLTRRKN